MYAGRRRWARSICLGLQSGDEDVLVQAEHSNATSYIASGMNMICWSRVVVSACVCPGERRGQSFTSSLERRSFSEDDYQC